MKRLTVYVTTAIVIVAGVCLATACTRATELRELVKLPQNVERLALYNALEQTERYTWDSEVINEFLAMLRATRVRTPGNSPGVGTYQVTLLDAEGEMVISWGNGVVDIGGQTYAVSETHLTEDYLDSLWDSLPVLTIEDFMPTITGKRMYYEGLSYRHYVVLQEVQHNHRTTYYFEGEYLSDAHPSEADYGDCSIAVEWTLANGVLYQQVHRGGGLFMDVRNGWQNKILLMEPLVEGRSWRQVITAPAGKLYIVTSKICDIGRDGDQVVIKVRHEDSSSGYYEEQEYKQGEGVAGFSYPDIRWNGMPMGYYRIYPEER